jgi:hypothetical protein
MCKIRTEGIHLYRVVSGYRMTDHKYNEISREMGITNVNEIITFYMKKLLEHLERMPES